MNESVSRQPGSPPSSFGILFWNFLLTLSGLAALLALPIFTQREHERYRAVIEDQIEPASRQVNRALDIVYDARNYAFSSYFLLDQTPHPGHRSRRESY